MNKALADKAQRVQGFLMPRGRGWAWLLVCALLAAQMLGLLHRVVHNPVAQRAAASHATVLQPTAGLAALFAGHGDDSCRLYDQLGHGDTLPLLPALAPPITAALFLLPFFHGEALARWAALFEARGPPFSR